MLAKLAGSLVLLLAFGAVGVNADSTYKIVGTLTIPGDSSNPNISETIDYSFELAYESGSTKGIPLERQKLGRLALLVHLRCQRMDTFRLPIMCHFIMVPLLESQVKSQ